jgi:hypothetical protein
MNHTLLSRYSFFALVLCIFLGGGLYKIKHGVSDLEKDLRVVRAQIVHAQESIHLLKAEWVYLNNPHRLEELNRKHLKLKPVETVQMASLRSIPHRGYYTNGQPIMLAGLKKAITNKK